MFFVLVYPYRECFLGDCDLSKNLFASPILKGINIINMSEYFIHNNFTLETFNQFSYDNTLHLTPQGHRLTAKIIHDIINDKYVQ